MRRALCALGVFLAGCPYIPGRWQDYAGPPAETQLVGITEFTEPQGGYWQDDRAFGTVLAGWLAAPEAGRTWMPELGCRRLDADEAVYDDAGLVEAGDQTLVFEGAVGNIDADWLPDAQLWYGDYTEGSFEPEGTYDLAPVTAAGHVLKADAVFGFPALLDFQGPKIDGQDLETVSIDDLTWTWSDGVAGERVWAQVTLRDAGLESLESVFCAVDAAEGRVDVPKGEFTKARDAAYATVAVEVLREGGARIGDNVGGARFTAGHSVLGYVKLE